VRIETIYPYKLSDQDLYRIITQKFVCDLYDHGVLEVPAAPECGSDAEHFDREVMEATVKFAAFHRLTSVHGLRSTSVRSYAMTSEEIGEMKALKTELRPSLALSDPYAAHQFLLYRLLLERAKQLA
jgi:hypothetical protein